MLSTILRQVFTGRCSFVGIGNLDSKGSHEGELQEKTEGSRDL